MKREKVVLMPSFCREKSDDGKRICLSISTPPWVAERFKRLRKRKRVQSWQLLREAVLLLEAKEN